MFISLTRVYQLINFTSYMQNISSMDKIISGKILNRRQEQLKLQKYG